MGLKEGFNKEKTDLVSKKRPYETAAFVIFAILFIQQVGLLMVSMIRFIRSWNFFSMGNQTTQVFFGRIIALDNSSWLYISLAFAALVVYYALIYIFVYKYSEKHGYAKWTWTLIVVFGPSILLTSPYYIYALYVFRPYVFRFLKRVVHEYQTYDPTKPFAEEEEAEETTQAEAKS